MYIYSGTNVDCKYILITNFILYSREDLTFRQTEGNQTMIDAGTDDYEYICRCETMYGNF